MTAFFFRLGNGVPPLQHPPNLTAVVADDLRRSIEKRTLGANGRLPSEPELARRMGVSRATIRHAVTELEEAGFVRRRQGRGTFVTGQATSLRNNLNVNSGVTDLIAAGGWSKLPSEPWKASDGQVIVARAGAFASSCLRRQRPGKEPGVL